MSNPLKFRQAISLPGPPTNILDAATKGYVDTLISTHTHSDYASVSTAITAGDGLIGGGTLASARTITLGAPSAISKSSTNTVTADSHTHALILTANDIGALATGEGFMDVFGSPATYFSTANPGDANALAIGQKALFNATVSSNLPTHTGVDYWYVESKTLYTADGQNVLQTATSYNGPMVIYVRRFGDSTWSSWMRQLDSADLGGIPDAITKDIFVAKNNAVVAVGVSEDVGWGGGLANYSGLAEASDVGIFANSAGGLVRVRPNGRTSSVGQVLFAADGVSTGVPFTTTNYLQGMYGRFYRGNPGTQAVVSMFGHNDNITRWAQVIEADGRLTLYAYLPDGTSGHRIFEVQSQNSGQPDALLTSGFTFRAPTTFIGDQSVTGSVTVSNQLSSIGPIAIGVVTERVGSAANSVMEARTTTGSVFFGQGRGGRFAVGLASDLSANWQFEVDGNGVRAKPIIDAQGGVMSSGHYTALGQADTYYAITPTSGRSVRFAANSSNNTGIYDTTNSKWLIQVNSANLTTLAGALRVNGTSQLVGNTSVTGTLTTTSHAYVNGGRIYGATELNLCGGSTTSLVRIRPQGWSSVGQTVFNANGTVTFSGVLTAPDYAMSSDIRLKSDIVPLEKRGRIEPIVYTMNGKRELGVSAQQIQGLWGEAVLSDSKGYLSVLYDRLVPVLAAQANATEDTVTELKEQVRLLQERLMTMEAIVLKMQ